MMPLYLLADFYAYRLHTLHASQSFFFLGRSIKKFTWQIGAKEAKILGYCISAGATRSVPSPSPSIFRLKISSQQLTLVWKLPRNLHFAGLLSD